MCFSVEQDFRKICACPWPCPFHIHANMESLWSKIRQRKRIFDPDCTGCFKANICTLTCNCDKYTLCTEKNMVDLFSVHPEISFHNNKSEKCFYSKNLNWKLESFNVIFALNIFLEKMAQIQVQSQIKYSISPRWAIALKGVASRSITS